MKGNTWAQRISLLLSAIAVLLCLYSASTFHYHDAGYHAAGNGCIGCDLDDLTTHGILSSQTLPFLYTYAHAVALVLFQTVHETPMVMCFFARAPPLLS